MPCMNRWTQTPRWSSIVDGWDTQTPTVWNWITRFRNRNCRDLNFFVVGIMASSRIMSSCITCSADAPPSWAPSATSSPTSTPLTFPYLPSDPSGVPRNSLFTSLSTVHGEAEHLQRQNHFAVGEFTYKLQMTFLEIMGARQLFSVLKNDQWIYFRCRFFYRRPRSLLLRLDSSSLFHHDYLFHFLRHRRVIISLQRPSNKVANFTAGILDLPSFAGKGHYQPFLTRLLSVNLFESSSGTA